MSANGHSIPGQPDDQLVSMRPYQSEVRPSLVSIIVDAKMNTPATDTIIEVTDQLEFLLEYLEQTDSGRSTLGEEGNHFSSQSSHYSTFYDEESSQPLNLSMKRNLSGAELGNLQPLSSSSSISNFSTVFNTFSKSRLFPSRNTNLQPL